MDSHEDNDKQQNVCLLNSKVLKFHWKWTNRRRKGENNTININHIACFHVLMFSCLEIHSLSINTYYPIHSHTLKCLFSKYLYGPVKNSAHKMNSCFMYNSNSWFFFLAFVLFQFIIKTIAWHLFLTSI